MPVLVTGANGLLGNNLCRELIAQGTEVRAFVRSNSNLQGLEGLPVSLHYGDVRDPKALAEAAHGCDIIYHTAAVFSYWGYSREEMLSTATNGATNAVAAAKQAGVKRMVLTASSSVLGPNWEPRAMTEADSSDLEGTPDYFYSKWLQEKTALEQGATQGVEVVSICPSVFVGPNDFKPSASLPTITGYLFDPMKLTYPGGVNIVHVQDVAKAHILLGNNGTAGQRYLVCGDNMHWPQVHELIASLSGVSKPKLRMGPKAALVGSLFMEMGAKLTGKPPLGTRDLAKMVGSYFWYDDQKAQRLGYNGRGSSRRAIVETLAWLLNSPHLTPAQRNKLNPHQDVLAAQKQLAESCAPTHFAP